MKFMNKIYPAFLFPFSIFLMSAQKHRLWVLVRTASARRFLRIPTICFKQKYEKYQSFLPEHFIVFGGKIFCIFEKACFRNDNADPN